MQFLAVGSLGVYVGYFIQFVTTFPPLLEDSLSNSHFLKRLCFPTVCSITFHGSLRFARSPHSLQWPFQSIEELGYRLVMPIPVRANATSSHCLVHCFDEVFPVVCVVFFSILLNNVSQFQLSYWHVHDNSSSCIPYSELPLSLLNLFWSTTTVP
jgi:hypothetical protein